VLKRSIHNFTPPFHPSLDRHYAFVIGTFATSNLTEILRVVVNAKQTGYLKMKEGEQEGCLAVENGIIFMPARLRHGLPALFQFVGWREARFEFHERPMPRTSRAISRSTIRRCSSPGWPSKWIEQNLLHEAVPSPDSVLCYMGGEGLARSR